MLPSDASITAYARRLSSISEGQYTWDGMRCEIKRMIKKGLFFTDKPIATMMNNKKQGKVRWREVVKGIRQMQNIYDKASYTQHFANIRIDSNEPILVVNLADLHIGARGVDYEQLEVLTDEIIHTPNLYIALNGDLLETAINMRGVKEVTNQILEPEMQMEVLGDWLNEIKHKVLWATWDNHTAEREEKFTGISMFKRILGKEHNLVYSNGICHVDLQVGEQTYKIVASHKFQGSSLLNPTHSQQRYMRFQGNDREIAMSGDTHRVGFSWYYDGDKERLAVNSGTLHVNSGYTKRYFSLFTVPKFPCVELYPDQHMFIVYPSVGHWKKSKETDQNTNY